MTDKEDVKEIARISGVTLKHSFAAWAVPQEKDFQALISLAEIGCQAVADLELAATGLANAGGTKPLQVVLNTDQGLHLTPGSGIGLNVNVSGGLQVVAGGLSIKTGTGIAIEPTTQVLTLQKLGEPLSQKQGMLEIIRGKEMMSGDTLGLTADASRGMAVSINGLRIHCSPTGGLIVDANGQLTLDLEYLMDR